VYICVIPNNPRHCKIAAYNGRSELKSTAILWMLVQRIKSIMPPAAVSCSQAQLPIGPAFDVALVSLHIALYSLNIYVLYLLD